MTSFLNLSKIDGFESSSVNKLLLADTLVFQQAADRIIPFSTDYPDFA
jgi:hypothetical protein